MMTVAEREKIVREIFGNAHIYYHDDWAHGKLNVESEVLLSLPAMVKWCEAFGVPFENLAVDAENGSTGCETCGYGSSVRIHYRLNYPDGSIV